MLTDFESSDDSKNSDDDFKLNLIDEDEDKETSAKSKHTDVDKSKSKNKSKDEHKSKTGKLKDLSDIPLTNTIPSNQLTKVRKIFFYVFNFKMSFMNN